MAWFQGVISGFDDQCSEADMGLGVRVHGGAESVGLGCEVVALKIGLCPLFHECCFAAWLKSNRLLRTACIGKTTRQTLTTRLILVGHLSAVTTVTLATRSTWRRYFCSFANNATRNAQRRHFRSSAHLYCYSQYIHTSRQVFGSFANVARLVHPSAVLLGTDLTLCRLLAMS